MGFFLKNNFNPKVVTESYNPIAGLLSLPMEPQWIWHCSGYGSSHCCTATFLMLWAAQDGAVYEIFLQKGSIIKEANPNLKEFLKCNMNKGSESKTVWDDNYSLYEKMFYLEKGRMEKRAEVSFRRLKRKLKKRS